MPPSTFLPVFRRLTAAASVAASAAVGIAQSLPQLGAADAAIPAITRESSAPPPASQFPAPQGSPYHLGSVILRPRISYSYNRSDGLPVQNGQRVDTSIQVLAAGINADLGRNWAIDYSPSWTTRSAKEIGNSFDQNLSLNGTGAVGDTVLSGSQTYAESYTTIAETASTLPQKTTVTSASLGYNLSERVQVQASASRNERATESLPTNKTWQAQLRASWRASNRLSVTFGPSYSYSSIEGASDFANQSLTSAINWSPTEKVTVALDAGVQRSQSFGANSVSQSHPTASLALQFHPLDTTGISATFSRNDSASYFSDQSTKNQQWAVALQQRLLGHLFLSATYGRNRNDYRTLNALQSVNRRDTIETYSARLSTRLLNRLSLAATYQDTRNRSTDAGFTFSTRQVGVELSLQF